MRVTPCNTQPSNSTDVPVSQRDMVLAVLARSCGREEGRLKACFPIAAYCWRHRSNRIPRGSQSTGVDQCHPSHSQCCHSVDQCHTLGSQCCHSVDQCHTLGSQCCHSVDQCHTLGSRCCHSVDQCNGIISNQEPTQAQP
jgi:hypothetical protein